MAQTRAHNAAMDIANFSPSESMGFQDTKTTEFCTL